MNTQPKLTVIENPPREDYALDVLRLLHQNVQALETMILDLPLREYEQVNAAVPKLDVRKTLTRTKERLQDGVNAMMNEAVA